MQAQKLYVSVRDQSLTQQLQAESKQIQLRASLMTPLKVAVTKGLYEYTFNHRRLTKRINKPSEIRFVSAKWKTPK